MTQMTVCPKEFGKCVIKSIVKFSHTWFGIGRGCNNPFFLCLIFIVLTDGTMFDNVFDCYVYTRS